MVQPLPVTPNPAPGAPAKRTSKLAVWALCLGVVGMCFFPFALVGAVLGVIALIKINQDPTLGGQALAIIAIPLVLIAIAVNGILAALAIPAFIGYVRRSKTAEVTKNMNEIFQRLDGAYREKGVIVSVPLTPSEVPCAVQHEWTAEERARFAPLGFAPDGPTYFSYEVVANPEDVPDAEAVIRGHGDLDCDGTTSLFELSLARSPEGGLERARGFYIDKEVE